MSGFYIGVDGKARKIKGGYIGIDGVARKIKKGYIGVDGVARLCWNSFSTDPVFANNSWENIALACQLNAVPDSWAVGDQKTMTIDGTNYTIDIIGKNHDTYSDGSGHAPLTFHLHYCNNGLWVEMHNDAINSIGWNGCTMRKTTLPSILEKMPAGVKSGIREVSKKTCKGNYGSGFQTTADKLFLLSEVEIIGEGNLTPGTEGVQYEYYAKGNNWIKNYGGSPDDYWTRSPNGSQNFCYVDQQGVTRATTADNPAYISFAFCL